MSLLKVDQLKIYYPVKRKKNFLSSERLWVKAVDDVSFELERGKILGIVGESGCGKSTLVRGIMGLAPVYSGEIALEGKNLQALKGKKANDFRRHYQMVFQDPEASLNPRLTVGEIIAEPLQVFENLSKKERDKKVFMLMEAVGLAPYMVRRFPHEFSGGQRQRICIARAIAVNPDLIVCDEAVSALDVSIQAQIINLLNDLKKEFNLTYLFISHDLSATRYISDEIMVMYLGKVVEKGRTEDIVNNPQHPYTKALLAAVPQYGEAQQENPLSGEIPSPINPPVGCNFCTRCPEKEEKCAEDEPLLQRLPDGRFSACHLLA